MSDGRFRASLGEDKRIRLPTPAFVIFLIIWPMAGVMIAYPGIMMLLAISDGEVWQSDWKGSIFLLLLGSFFTVCSIALMAAYIFLIRLQLKGNNRLS
jgi:uncharacterized membrane protein YbhN (UPF0104 family)